MKLLKHIIIAALFYTVMHAVYADSSRVSISSAHIIYPADERETAVTLHNSSTTDTYIILSYVDDANGVKATNMIVTPSLVISHPGDEHTLRILYTGGALAKNREELYYFTEKTIPSIVHQSITGKNIVTMTTTQRVKFFVRPKGLTLDASEAPNMLTFHRVGNRLVIDNPTPYYITLAALKAGDKALHDGIVAPFSSFSQHLPAGVGSTVTFNSINDLGAMTPIHRVSF